MDQEWCWAGLCGKNRGQAGLRGAPRRTCQDRHRPGGGYCHRFGSVGVPRVIPFLVLQLKWCAWIAVYCSFISFANSRSSEDTKQMMSSFM